MRIDTVCESFVYSIIFYSRDFLYFLESKTQAGFHNLEEKLSNVLVTCHRWMSKLNKSHADFWGSEQSIKGRFWTGSECNDFDCIARQRYLPHHTNQNLSIRNVEGLNLDYDMAFEPTPPLSVGSLADRFVDVSDMSHSRFDDGGHRGHTAPAARPNTRQSSTKTNSVSDHDEQRPVFRSFAKRINLGLSHFVDKQGTRDTLFSGSRSAGNTDQFANLLNKGAGKPIVSSTPLGSSPLNDLESNEISEPSLDSVEIGLEDICESSCVPRAASPRKEDCKIMLLTDKNPSYPNDGDLTQLEINRVDEMDENSQHALNVKPVQHS